MITLTSHREQPEEASDFACRRITHIECKNRIINSRTRNGMEMEGDNNICDPDTNPHKKRTQFTTPNGNSNFN